MLYSGKKIPIMKTSRRGLQDMWNAFMLEGATYSNNDIPLCPTTATALPSRLISFEDAKTIHKKESQKGNQD